MKNNPRTDEQWQSLLQLIVGHLEHVGMLKVHVDGSYSKQPAVITEMWEEWCETDAELTEKILELLPSLAEDHPETISPYRLEMIRETVKIGL